MCPRPLISGDSLLGLWPPNSQSPGHSLSEWQERGAGQGQCWESFGPSVPLRGLLTTLLGFLRVRGPKL